MGWYDAFRKTGVTDIDSKALSAGTGTGAMAFGDAFKDIGKSMVESDTAQKEALLTDAKIEAANAQTASANASTASTQQSTEKAKYDMTQTKTKETQKTFDDAFKRDIALASNPEDLVTKFGYTEESMKKLSPDAIKYGEDYYQGKFNSEAQNLASGYKTFEEFKKANPKIVDMADGATIAKIDKYYRDNDTTAATIDAKTKDLKHATAVNQLKSKIAKAEGGESKEEQVKRKKNEYFNKMAKGMVEKTINENSGVVTQDQEQVNFLTDYLDTNYDPSTHKNYEDVKAEALSAWSAAKEQRDKADVEDATRDETLSKLDNWDKLSLEQQTQAKEFYKESGTLPSVLKKDRPGFFSGNDYSLDMPVKKDTQKPSEVRKDPLGIFSK